MELWFFCLQMEDKSLNIKMGKEELERLTINDWNIQMDLLKLCIKAEDKNHDMLMEGLELKIKMAI
ncbi:hypothetical protein X975_05486, partial [Stegodyphus mimosarum]